MRAREDAPRRSWRVLRRVLGVVAVLVLAAVLGAVWWLAEGDEATPAALAAVQQDGGVVVDRVEDVWRVLPADRDPTATLVLYPGARVEPDAYVATLAPTVRRTGVAVLLPTMPVNVALLRSGRASSMRADLTDADGDRLPGPWVIGGHSLGGVAAAMFLDGDPASTWDGLLLLASFPAGGTDLSDRDDLAVLPVAGTDDGLVSVDDVRAGLDRLPTDTEVSTIDGLNHAGFGRYGGQMGDDDASRDADATLADLTDAISTWLEDDVLDAPG